MALEVLEKRGPVEWQAVLLEVPKRERKSVIDPNQCRPVFREPLNQPLSDAATAPVLATPHRRRNLNGWGRPIRHIDAQPLEAGRRCLRTGVVDSNVAVK
jgi:hypothetical protein